MEPKTGTLICRKCNGPHLTIKCGKDKKEEVISPTPITQIGRKTYKELREMNEPILDKKYKEQREMNEPISDKKYKEQREMNEPITDKKYKDYIENDFVERDRVRRPSFKATFRVKLSNLPIDMTEEEMIELTCDWGHVVRIRVINYEESSTSYIDFGYEDEAKYFIEAIDRTPFDNLLLSAMIVSSERVKDKEIDI